MSDIDATKVGKEISKPDVHERIDAWKSLQGAMSGTKPEDIKNLADKITKGTDLHALGLDGFHLDQKTPIGVNRVSAKDADAIAVQNGQTPQHKALSLPYFNFTDGTKTVALLPNGAEFDEATAKAMRAPDIAAPAAAAPGDAPAAPAAPAAAAPGDAPAAPAAPAAPGDAPAAPAAPAAPGDAPAAPAAPAAPGDAPAAPGDAPAAPTDASTVSDADKAKVQQFIQKNVDDNSVSAPVKRGEGYYQVIRRMNPDMTPEDAVKAARHMRDLNGGNINLKVGDKLPLMSDADKKAQAQQAMDAFSKMSPADQAKTIAAAKAAFPDAPAPAAPAPGDAPAAPATPAPGDAPAAPAPATPAPGDAPAAPAPATPAPGDAPAAPAPATPAPGDAPAAPLADPSAPPSDAAPAPAAPAAVPADANWVPTLDPTSKTLQPHGDVTQPANLLYNPLAPIGLSEGDPGKPLTTTTGGVDERAVTTDKDPSKETISGKIADRDLLHWLDTRFTTHDTLQNGKLATRETVYGNNMVNMKFQGGPGQAPIEIDEVRNVKTTVSGKGYSTTVTNNDGKQWTFKSDDKGVVTDAREKTS
jgi:hypothetical protein